MKIIQTKIKNKLNSVLIPIKDSSNVSIVVLLKVGSRHEQTREEGLAHFIEHTLFKGTKKRPTSKDVAMDIELIGGDSNAFTSYEYTGYYIKVPAENYAGALEVLSDIIQNPLFNDKEIEKERGVIIEEIKMYKDIPRELVGSKFNEALFKDHALGKEISGTIRSVTDMKRQQFINFIDKNYNTDNMVITIAGKIDTKETEDLLIKYFSDLEPGEKVTAKETEARDLGKEVELINRKSEQVHIVLGGFAPKRDTKTRYIMKTGNSILSYGFGSLLFQALREQLGVAYYAYSHVAEYQDIGKFTVSLGVDSKRVEEAIDEVLKQLSILKLGKFSDLDFERARNYLLGYFITQLEGSDEIARWIGIQCLLDNRLPTREEAISSIKRVTKEEVMKLWGEILVENNLRVSILGNLQKPPDVNFDLLA